MSTTTTTTPAATTTTATTTTAAATTGDLMGAGIGVVGGGGVGYLIAKVTKLDQKKHWTWILIAAGAALGGYIGYNN